MKKEIILLLAIFLSCFGTTIAIQNYNDGLSTITIKKILEKTKATKTNSNQYIPQKPPEDTVRERVFKDSTEELSKGPTHNGKDFNTETVSSNYKGLPKNISGQCPDFRNLRTTDVAGIYCQQVADDGTFRRQKHYFYNKKTEKLVLIPSVFFVGIGSQGKELSSFIKII